MDPVKNPYSPGAGTPPPELAGRADVIGNATISLKRIARGKPTQSVIMVGLRGVGKTVLLNRMKTIALEEGFETAFIEAHEGKSLPELLVPSLRSCLYKLSTLDSAKDKARRGIRVLKSFLSGLKVSMGDI